MLPSRVHDGQLPALQRIACVRVDLPHQIPQRIVRRNQKGLLPIGREVHVALLKLALKPAADRFLAGALQIERGLALALRIQQTFVHRPHLEHVAQPLQQGLVFLVGDVIGPGANGVALIVENTDQALGVVVTVGGL